MAIRESELEDGKDYFFFATHKFTTGSVFTRLMLVRYVHEHQRMVGARGYKLKILKNYFHSATRMGGAALYKPGDTYPISVLKPLYKENYRAMKRRFIRKVLGEF